MLHDWWMFSTASYHLEFIFTSVPKYVSLLFCFLVVVKRCHGKSFIYHYINTTRDNQLFFYMKFTFFFQHVIFNKDISAANLRYVTTKLDLVMDSACDKSLFGCQYFNVECSYRHVQRQISLAATLRWKVEKDGKGWEFIWVRRWSRSFAWSRDGQWGFPLAPAVDCLPQLLRGSLQGDQGCHHCPGHGTPFLSL